MTILAPPHTPTAPDQATAPVADTATSAALLTAATAIAQLRQARVMGVEAITVIRRAVSLAPVEVVLDPLDDYLRSIGQDPAVLYRWATPLSKVQVVEWLRGAARTAVAQLTAPNIRTGYIQGLRALADLLEQHPGLSLPYFGVSERPLDVYLAEGRDGNVIGQTFAYATAMTSPTAEFTAMNGDPAFWLTITGVLGGIRVSLHLRAHEVCERTGGGWVLPAALAELVDLKTEAGEG